MGETQMRGKLTAVGIIGLIALGSSAGTASAQLHSGITLNGILLLDDSTAPGSTAILGARTVLSYAHSGAQTVCSAVVPYDAPTLAIGPLHVCDYARAPGHTAELRPVQVDGLPYVESSYSGYWAPTNDVDVKGADGASLVALHAGTVS
jgi:hypothetical protein